MAIPWSRCKFTDFTDPTDRTGPFQARGYCLARSHPQRARSLVRENRELRWPSPDLPLTGLHIEAHYRQAFGRLKASAGSSASPRAASRRWPKRRAGSRSLKARIVAKARARVDRRTATDEMALSGLNDAAKQEKRLLAETAVTEQYVEIQTVFSWGTV